MTARPARRAALWLALTLTTSASALAEQRVDLDPEATKITFTLDAVAHTVRGTARLVRGQFRIEPASGTIAGELVVDAASAETGRAARDADMHEKVLSSRQYPEIVFRASRLEGEFRPRGGSDIRLHGTISIHGAEHPLTLPLSIISDCSVLVARGSFEIPYVEWGMKDPSFFVFRVAKVVSITVEARATLGSH